MTVSEPPPAPVPDGQDWTWVIERPCPDCGFDAPAFDRTTLAGTLDRIGRAWAAVLERDDARHRPSPTVWSPVEYAAHVRDVFRLYRHRLDLMLADDGAHFENWDQDATAVAERYDLADPNDVRLELLVAAEALSARYADVGDADWARRGYRSDGSAFTIDTFTRYLVHDPTHHLWDVGG